MKYKVSIVLATYNGEAFLETQFKSLINQTVKPDEIIVSDDGSDDCTVELLERCKRETGVRVKILKSSDNSGPTFNFERALIEAKGDLIFFSDQDDEWNHDKIEKFVIAYKDHSQPHLILCNRMHVAHDLTEMKGEDSLSRCERLGIHKNFYGPGCAMMITGKFKEIVLPFPRHRDSTYDSWMNNLALHLDSRYLIPEVLQKYRVRDDSASSHIIGNSSRSLRLNYYLYKWRSRLKYGRRDSVRLLQLQRERILENSEWIDSQASISTSSILRNIDNRIKYYKTKTKIKERFLPFRFPLICRALKSGFYKEHEGFKGIFKDLIFP
jgi:glycosyltransferase involved in cell wall biosynthesis